MANNNYMLTLAAEHLYQAAQRLLSALDSTSYQDPETRSEIYKLRDSVAQYRSLAYHSDRQVEVPGVKILNYDQPRTR